MSSTALLLDHWYVAAKAKEVGREPLARTICGVPLVLYRKADGGIVALDDRCPHRRYPLSKGKLVGDDIQCGYHGIRFGSDGACALIPAQREIPRGFATRAFPAVERSALVHVFMGDPAKADAGAILDFPENVAEGWAAVDGYRHVEANNLLVIDNLLDLTHLTFVHVGTLAGPGIQENPLVVTTEGDLVRARRVMPDVEPAPIFRIMREFGGRIDRYQNITFMPPNHVHIRIDATPPGEADDPDKVHHVVINHLTPETERTTHYFWSVARRLRLGDADVSRKLYEMNRNAFEEDAEVLRLQQQMLDAEGARPGGEGVLANLASDSASAAARRVLRRLGGSGA